MDESRGTYSFFDHAADVGINVSAPTRDELFATAGRALMEWIGPVPPGPPETEDLFRLEAADQEELLVRWLQELLYRFHHQHSYFLGCRWMELQDSSMRVQPFAVRWHSASGHTFQEVKAVTYHKLRVANVGGEWTACVILDI